MPVYFCPFVEFPFLPWPKACFCVIFLSFWRLLYRYNAGVNGHLCVKQAVLQ